MLPYDPGPHIPWREFFIFILPIGGLYVASLKMLSYYRFHKMKFVKYGILQFVLSVAAIVVCMLFYTKKIGIEFGNTTDFLWGVEMTIVIVYLLSRSFRRLRICFNTKNKRLRRKYLPGSIFWILIAIPFFLFSGAFYSMYTLFTVLFNREWNYLEVMQNLHLFLT